MCPIHYESPHEITDQPMPLLNLDKDTSDKLQFSIPECEGGRQQESAIINKNT